MEADSSRLPVMDPTGSVAIEPYRLLSFVWIGHIRVTVTSHVLDLLHL